MFVKAMSKNTHIGQPCHQMGAGSLKATNNGRHGSY
jgi:hypothetical protein